MTKRQRDKLKAELLLVIAEALNDVEEDGDYYGSDEKWKPSITGTLGNVGQKLMDKASALVAEMEVEDAQK